MRRPLRSSRALRSRRWRRAACNGRRAMVNVRSVSACAAAAAMLVAIGCEHNESREPVAGTAPTQGVTNEQNAATEPVVRQLAEARCAHEQQCNNIGDGKKYATNDVCLDQTHGNLANDLNAYNCPKGIDQRALDKCIASLRASDCNISLSRLAQERDCRSGAMCMK